MSAERDLHADDDAPPSSQRPTVKPPAQARASGLRLRATAPDLPIQEVLARFELGDYLGALSVAGELFDDGRVPVLIVERAKVRAYRLEERHEALVAVVDGETGLEVLLDKTGLSMIDGLRTLCELVEKRVLTLR